VSQIKLLFCLAFIVFSGLHSTEVFALGFEGEISFSRAEKSRHLEGLAIVQEAAARCLERDYAHHRAFFARHGISPYYGDRSDFARMSREGKQNLIRSLGKDPALLDQMEPTSCVGLTLKCLGEGFTAANQADLWQRLRAFTMANAVDGTALQHGLQALGWKILFWNPDLSRNAAWDAAEKAADPTNRLRFWGYHEYRTATVNRNGSYYFNRVDDARTLVNFGTRTPEAVARIPFFVGTAHTGYHVFPGAHGRVIEGHSTRAITDPQTIESSEFNPLANGGGPRGEYRSGLMAIPPGAL
jgi:hypothetical protein